MTEKITTCSIILAAGRGSRMKGFEGNKTLLPLVPGTSSFEGSRPILLHILENLPEGPKAVVVNHKKEEVLRLTRSFGLRYCEQPILNGTGGGLLAAGEFISEGEYERVIITMGDVPLVRSSTYLRLLKELEKNSFVVLCFSPPDKKQYGVLEMEAGDVKRIVEWKYWQHYPPEKQSSLRICNSGIYAARRKDLLRYLPVLKERPHKVLKERGGKMMELEEFFLTDLVEFMAEDGLRVGYIVVEDEHEVMGVDDLDALKKAQALFKSYR